MSIDNSSWADIFAIAPEWWTSGGAAGAENALCGIVKTLALGRSLKAFRSRGRVGVDKERHDRLVVIKKRLHVHDQIFDHRQAQDRLNGDRVTGQ